MSLIEDELERRLAIWDQVKNLENVKPQVLRDLEVYGGASGVWVNKRGRTSHLARDGITVGILHTGRHYPDDVTDDAIIYRYPKTSRPVSRDAAEVQATKNAKDFGLPVFVIFRNENNKVTASPSRVRLGWVQDWDDDAKHFLILYGEQRPAYAEAHSLDAPFHLTAPSRARRTTSTISRPGQATFKFNVISNYGVKCAMCDIAHEHLLVACHICGVEHGGSDDWRNGIPLCPTHHTAFDRHLFAVNPETLEVEAAQGVKLSDIGVTVCSLSLLKNKPHEQALKWRYKETQKKWRNP